MVMILLIHVCTYDHVDHFFLTLCTGPVLILRETGMDTFFICFVGISRFISFNHTGMDTYFICFVGISRFILISLACIHISYVLLEFLVLFQSIKAVVKSYHIKF